MKSLFDLSRQKAIVTGATGSIGKVAAKALAEQGAKIVLTGRNHDKLKKTSEEFPQHSVMMECFNLLDLNELESFFIRHADAQILVNSVGVNDPKSILEVEESSYDSVMEANLKNAFFQTKYFFNAVKKKHAENLSIIHISSQMGHVGGFERTVYCSSKHGLEGLTKAASIELGKHNVRINTIAPTFINTPMTESTLKDSKKLKAILSKISLGRLGELRDIAGAVVYLASPASSLVTGSCLKIDGGWTAH